MLLAFFASISPIKHLASTFILPQNCHSRQRRHSCIEQMSSSDNEHPDPNEHPTSPLFHGVSSAEYVAAMKTALATDPALQAKVRLDSMSTSLSAHLHRPRCDCSHHVRIESQISRRSFRRHRRQAAHYATIQFEVCPVPPRRYRVSSAAS